ncbi:MAG: hypothetical protein HY275_10085, partial [Gemmatimonadetes bacterium]|nr:hypothetical protein [Gemmatimonadota bacterium]
MSDERRLVQQGLRRLIDREPRWAEWPEATLRGRLLDEVGSDNRPLVLLLLRVHDLGIPQRLPPAVIDPAHWERARGTLSQRVQAELFVPPDIGAWAVESWAWALQVIDEEFLLSPPARVAPPQPASRVAGGASAATTRTSGSPRAGMALPARSGGVGGRGAPPPIRTTATGPLRGTTSTVPQGPPE